MERFIPVEIFQKKSNYISRYFFFPVLTETTAIFCTICLDYQCEASCWEKVKNLPVFCKGYKSIPFLFSVPKKIPVPIMRTLTCKRKILGENWLCLSPYLKAFPIFNVLKTCREYFLTIDLGIVEFIKKFIERFLEKCEILRHGPNYVQKLYQKRLNAS